MSEAAHILPELRSDLQLLRGAQDSRGVASWRIYDPVRHRYFQLDDLSAQLLALWKPINETDFMSFATAELGADVSPPDVRDLSAFLYANNLTLEPPGNNANAYVDQIEASRRGFASRVVHGYLFFKIPLFRPQTFLKATYPLVAPLYSRSVRIAVVVLTLLGLYLASRQWETFQQTFLDFISLEGALAFGLSLVVVKSLHELGHAYTATRHGVRVNTMGVAFMLAMPILYTDVTDAWRLTSRRKMLAIAGAGIIVELAIAGLATFLWVFLSPGPLRSVAFLLATTSWILSLALNLNPFMRFDGYYLLADFWKIPNLQTRSFDLAKWALRERLFGLGKPAPEDVPIARRRMLIAYAVGVWIYRLILFTGIALLVYHAFFKVLGVTLFVIEIVWFIALPIFREIMEWWKMRHEIVKTRRAWVSGSVFLALVAACFLPLSSTVRIPGVLAYENEFQIFAPHPAQIVSANLEDGQFYRKGTEVVVLQSDDISHKIKAAELKIATLNARLNRIAGDSNDRRQRTILEAEARAAARELEGLKQEARRLKISAPFDGQLRDVLPSIALGDWIDSRKPIGTLVDPSSITIFGYIHEDDVWRISLGQHVRFIPEYLDQETVDGEVEAIARTGAVHIDLDYLASVYGGVIPSDRVADGKVVPRSGWYAIRARIQKDPIESVARGTLHIAAQKETFAAIVWRRILQVLVREAGV